MSNFGKLLFSMWESDVVVYPKLPHWSVWLEGYQVWVPSKEIKYILVAYDTKKLPRAKGGR